MEYKKAVPYILISGFVGFISQLISYFFPEVDAAASTRNTFLIVSMITLAIDLFLAWRISKGSKIFKWIFVALSMIFLVGSIIFTPGLFGDLFKGRVIDRVAAGLTILNVYLTIMALRYLFKKSKS